MNVHKKLSNYLLSVDVFKSISRQHKRNDDDGMKYIEVKQLQL